MVTTEYRKTYDSLPDTVKSAMLALSILIDRIGSLPKADRDDLFELLQEWRNANDREEQVNIHHAMEEILAQTPVKAAAMDLSTEEPLTRGLKAWSDHVGKKIRELREERERTQVELAKLAGIPQSHLSRLENAEHSATHFTLQKIAKALGVSVSTIDPCSDD
jgi:DNA-binding XRE family transcriptional regulator